MKTKINSLCKSKYLVVYVVVLITFLSSCALPRYALNIKSVDDLKGRKLLVGRFVLYVNGNHVPVITRTTRSGRSVLNPGPTFKKEGEKQRKMFSPKDDGYVYIAVTAGQYYIRLDNVTLANINKNKMPSVRINIYDTDEVVNFGTIKFEVLDYQASKVPTAVNVVTAIIAGVSFTKGKGSLLVTQVPEWNDTRNYALSQLNVPPQLIRDEKIPDLLNGLKFD
jgi:hypothetical protein